MNRQKLAIRLLEHLQGRHNQKSHGNKYGSAAAIKGNVARIGKDKAALKAMAARVRADSDFQQGVKDVAQINKEYRAKKASDAERTAKYKAQSEEKARKLKEIAARREQDSAPNAASKPVSNAQARAQIEQQVKKIPALKRRLDRGQMLDEIMETSFPAPSNVSKHFDEKLFTKSNLDKQMIIHNGINSGDGFRGVIMKKEAYSDNYHVAVQDGEKGIVFGKSYPSMPTRAQVLEDSKFDMGATKQAAKNKKQSDTIL